MKRILSIFVLTAVLMMFTACNTKEKAEKEVTKLSENVLSAYKNGKDSTAYFDDEDEAEYLEKKLKDSMLLLGEKYMDDAEKIAGEEKVNEIIEKVKKVRLENMSYEIKKVTAENGKMAIAEAEVLIPDMMNSEENAVEAIKEILGIDIYSDDLMTVLPKIIMEKEDISYFELYSKYMDGTDIKYEALYNAFKEDIDRIIEATLQKVPETKKNKIKITFTAEFSDGEWKITELD